MKMYVLSAWLIMGAIVVALAVLGTRPSDHSIASRASSIESQVRCPVCPEPIPVTDVQNAEAIQMRSYIVSELVHGKTEGAILQELANGYGASILLAPPASGFTILAWLVPGVVFATALTATLFMLLRWHRQEAPTSVAQSVNARDIDWESYSLQLDAELSRPQ